MAPASTLVVGCGYLGIRVSQRLAERGDEVHGTTRTPRREPELKALGVAPVLVDVLASSTISDLPRVDRVLYCVGYDRKGDAPIRDVYVDGLGRVLDRLPNSVRTFVYVSSTGVYGRDDGGWVDEDAPAAPRSESGRACLAAEGLVRDAAAAGRFRGVVLRYSGLYGPGRVVRKAGVERGEIIPGDPDKFLNLIQIDDAATAAIAALDRPEAGSLYNVSDDLPLRRREYYEAVARILGVAPPEFAPPEPGSTAAARDESNKRISNRRIKDALGLVWRYPDARLGVADALART